MWSLRFAAFLTLVMGVTNLLSSFTPAFHDHPQKLRTLFPLEVLHGTRRSFDAIERLLTEDIVHATDPYETLEAYHVSV